MSSDKNIDVCVLTLKRWNLYQDRTLVKDDGENYGKYVSFQNYHFIEPRSVPIKPNQNENIFTTAYKIFPKNNPKNADKANITQEVYVQQNLLLFGSSQSQEFWKSDTSILYITMIQLADSQKVPTENSTHYNIEEKLQMEQEFEKIFKAANIDATQWALYYSLDFCDLVLLTKNLCLDTYQDILWTLSPVRSDNLSVIRDTTTIYSIQSDYLFEQFDRFENQKQPPQDGFKDEGQAPQDNLNNQTFSLAITLNVQCLATWNALKQKLDEMGISYKPFRVLGRYDTELVLNDITFPQSLQVIHYINNLIGETSEDTFGCCEIIPLATPYGQEGNGNLSPKDPKFQKTACETLNNLFSAYTKAFEQTVTPSWGYASEISRSLRALLTDGFAEEFALSVFHSFAEYMRFVAKKLPYDKKHNTENRAENLYTFQRQYFQALSMLTHCTMHSEKQFIYAPAFNASLWDVPPKLLAFYSSIAYRITQLLNDDEQTFSFLFSPDFRPDIHVRPISYGEHGDNKISIIYLDEKQFYDPVAVIETMCHEIAHHVGKHSRCRKQRADMIFETIAAYLIYNTLPVNSTCLESIPPLVSKLCQAFQTLIRQSFEHTRKNHKPSRQYYLIDIAAFLKENNYFFDLLNEPMFKRSLQQEFEKALTGEDTRQDIDKMLELLGKKYHSEYLYNLSVNPDTRPAAINILASEIVLTICNQCQRWLSPENSGFKNYMTFCEYTLQAFSEAYSDLRMLELLHIEDVDIYNQILTKNTDYRLNGQADTEDFQFRLRHNAVCKALRMDDWDPFDRKDEDPETMLLVNIYAQHTLGEYLKLCPKGEYDQELNKIIQGLESKDAKNIYNTIRSEIMYYRKQLMDYCNEISKKSRERV